MKRLLPLAGAAVVALALAACGESATGPQRQTEPRNLSADVAIACDTNPDRQCTATLADPIQDLVNALTVRVDALNVPPAIRARLMNLLNQLPTVLAGLTPEQRSEAIQRTQALIALVQSLTPRFIPVDVANEIIALAEQVLAALNPEEGTPT